MKKIIAFVVLLISLIFTMATSAAIPNLDTDIQTEETLIKQTITTYFTARYESLKMLMPVNFSQVVAGSENEITQDWLQMEQDRQEIELFIAKTFGVYILEYKFSLDYVSIEINSGEAKVSLIEGNEIAYSTSPDFPSEMANLAHTITLIKTGDTWRISSDQYSDNTTQLLDTLSKEEVFSNIKTNYEAQFLPPVPVETTAPDASYSRSKAVSWADTYAKTVQVPVPSYIRNRPGWNSSWPTYYKVYTETDCTNFVSQAVFAGTNWTNSDPNYFEPNFYHYNDWWYYRFSPSVDGPSPWISVGSFTTFITNNSGSGPKATNGGANVCGLSKGDPITMKKNGQWRHAVIVSQILSGNCNDPAKVLVDSHTDYYKREPLTRWSGYTWYTLRITGYKPYP
jgi:hypothetical protein